MSVVSKAYKYYTRLSITSMSYQMAVVVYTALLLFVLFLAYVLTGPVYVLAYVAAFTLLPIVVLLSLRHFNLKRAITFSVLAVAIALPVEAISMLIKVPLVVVPSIMWLYVIVRRGIGSRRRVSDYVLLYLIVLGVSAALLVSGIETTKLACIRVSMLVSSTTLGFLALKVLNRLSEKLNVDIIKLGNAWTMTILANDSAELEELFEKLSVGAPVTARAVIFERTKGSIVLVAPGVHFGPFRRIGSSALPYIVEDEFKKIGLTPLIFHGAGSHELDLPSIRVSRFYASELASRILKSVQELKCSDIGKPYRVQVLGEGPESSFEAVVYDFGGSLFAVLMNPVRGGDDVPLEVQKISEELARTSGLKDLVIIDAHNNQGPRITDASKYIPVIKAVISTSTSLCSKVRVGLGVSKVKHQVLGLCSSEVKVFTLECDGEAYSLVYLYGNNARPGLRDEIRHALTLSGAFDAEVVTADDHTCSGTTFDAPYFAVESSKALVEASIEAFKNSVKDLDQACVKYLKTSIYLPVMGDQIYRLLEVAVEAGRILARAMVFVILGLMVLTLMASLLVL